MQELRQNTAVTVHFGPGLDKGDGVTPETGLGAAMDNATTGIRIGKNGVAMIDRNDGTEPAHDVAGFYQVGLSTADTDTLGVLLMQYEEAATCLAIWEKFRVISGPDWDAKYKELTASGAGSPTTIIDASLTEGNDYWNGYLLEVIGGTNIGYTGVVNDFVAATDTLTVAPAAPASFDATTKFLLKPNAAFGALNFALDIKTYAEIPQGAPPLAATFREGWQYPYQDVYRAKQVSDGTSLDMFLDNDSTIARKRAVSETAGPTLNKQKVVSG